MPPSPDHTDAYFALAGAFGGGLLGAVAAHLRQRAQFAHDSDRLRDQLDHDRRLKDLDELRTVLDRCAEALLDGGRKLHVMLNRWEHLSDPPTPQELESLRAATDDTLTAGNEIARQRVRAAMRLHLLSPILGHMSDVADAMKQGRELVTKEAPSESEKRAFEQSVGTLTHHHGLFLTLAQEYVAARTTAWLT